MTENSVYKFYAHSYIGTFTSFAHDREFHFLYMLHTPILCRHSIDIGRILLCCLSLVSIFYSYFIQKSIYITKGVFYTMVSISFKSRYSFISLPIHILLRKLFIFFKKQPNRYSEI